MSKQKDPAVVRELTASPKNPRKISAKRSAQLAKSMAKFGDLSSITYNKRSGHLISGHQRVRNLLPNARIEVKAQTDDTGTVAVGRILSGKNSWPYRVVDFDDATESAALIAANAQGGEFDDIGLAKLVKGLDLKGFDMDLLGLNNLEDILAGDNDPAGSEDETPAVGTSSTKTKRGDIWTCGDHRVGCLDSTDGDDVQRLVGHEPASCVFLDPPYGVSYAAASGAHEVIAGDHKRDDDLYALVVGALKQAVSHSTDGASFYIWHASSTRREFEDAMRDAGLVEKQYIIWVKNSLVLGHADYHWAHEPAFFACKQGQKTAWHGDRAQSMVWRTTLKKKGEQATTLGQGIVLTDGLGGSVALVPKLPKGKKVRTVRLAPGQTINVELAGGSNDIWEVESDHSGYKHPTQKPCGLAINAFKNSTKPGEVVLDLFSGSGSTLIAAEISGRRARVCDIDPKYAWLAVERWQDMTERLGVIEK